MTNPRHVGVRFSCAPALIGIGTPFTHATHRWHSAPQMEPEEVAHGVFVIPSLNTTENLVDGNSTFIIGSGAVLVVDAPSPRLTQAHLAWLRRRTNLPVKYLVQTHRHPDHTRGTATLTDAFREVSILASEFTRRIGGRNVPAFIRTVRGGVLDSSVARLNIMSRFRERFEGSDLDRQWAFDNYFLGYRRAFGEAAV
jgi:glyoxylase-like metal-dependent hydrolase (beta-lactamase superfamily II)